MDETITKLQRELGSLDERIRRLEHRETVSEIRRRAGLIGGRARASQAIRSESGAFLPKQTQAKRQTKPRQNQTHPDKTIDPTPTALVRRAFLNAFQLEFGMDYPGWGAKENGQAKAWLRSISLEQALAYAALYPKWNDPWISRMGHPFGLLVSSYVKLEAWSRRAESVIEKIAEGQARENVAMGQVQSLKEITLYADRADRRREAANPTLGAPVQGTLQKSAEGQLPRGGGELPANPTPFDLPTVPDGFSPSDDNS